MRFPFKPIITSLLDADLYKFTMWQALFHAFSGNQAEYRFVCRNTPQYPLAELVAEVTQQLEHLCTLRFDEKELSYLGSRSFIKSDFVDFLRIFRFQMHYLIIATDGDTLIVKAKGPQIHIMGFETFVTAIVNELYFRRLETPQLMQEGRRRLNEKIKLYENLDLREFSGFAGPLTIAEFGTRRRFSKQWQEEVLQELVKRIPLIVRGTSNVKLAMDYGLTPIGTKAHEYYQTWQAVGVQLRDFQKAALQGWVNEYRGDLGIALTDTIGIDAFLQDFDLYFAKLYDGVRNDSGDPYAWGERIISHYQGFKIDSKSKRLVFSNDLNFEKMLDLYRRFGARAQISGGIGTYLTNDMGIEPLSLVMKLVRCNDQPVAKISDSDGKTLCDDKEFVAYLRKVFNR